MSQPEAQPAITSDYDQLSKLVKLYALHKAKESRLTIGEKAKLFDDLSRWARNISDRILLAIEMDEVTPGMNINQ